MDRPDLPILSLLVANGCTIALALAQEWQLGAVLAVYWFQSVTIGAFTFARLLGAGVRADRGEGLATVGLALFFAFHYGLFHAVYLVFIAAFAFGGVFGITNLPGVALGCAAFFVTHLVSYLWYRPRQEPPMQVFAEPYARIVPMHVAIIAGGFVTALLPGETGARLVLLLFLLLKTGADVVAHRRKHSHAAPAPAPARGEVVV